MFRFYLKNIHRKSGNTNNGDSVKNPLKKNLEEITDIPENSERELPIYREILNNELYLKKSFGESMDILIKTAEADSAKLLFCMADTLCDNLLVTQQIVKPLLENTDLPSNPEKLMNYISQSVIAGVDIKKAYSLQQAEQEILSGMFLVFCEGVDYCLCFGVQRFTKRGVEQSQSEVNEKSSLEAFCECFKDNLALLRRRIRSPKLHFDTLEAGVTSKTRICLCYLTDRVNYEILNQIKNQINSARFDTVLSSGSITELIEGKRFALFSAVGSTERPDTACAEMAEGRILIIIDGTPFALIAPYLFSENFQTVDDYNVPPFYALFTRILKYSAFFIAIFLPSVYIAVCSFHHEVLPVAMLYDMAVQESITPFPVLLETVFIHFVYEIVREAGVRMPKSVGNAVSIVGGLVIGDAAVSAGLIAAPMLIVVAMSAITSFVIPKLYQPVAFLRFVFMIIAGVSGFYGIAIGFCVMLINICSQNPFSVPFTSPFAPLFLSAFRDTLFRQNWTKLSRRSFNISSMEK